MIKIHHLMLAAMLLLGNNSLLAQQETKKSKKISVTIINEEDGKKTVIDTTFENADQESVDVFLQSKGMDKSIPPVAPVPPTPPIPPDAKGYSYHYKIDRDDFDFDIDLDAEMKDLAKELEKVKKELRKSLEKSKLSKEEMKRLQDEIEKELEKLNFEYEKDGKRERVIIRKKTSENVDRNDKDEKIFIRNISNNVVWVSEDGDAKGNIVITPGGDKHICIVKSEGKSRNSVNKTDCNVMVLTGDDTKDIDFKKGDDERIIIVKKSEKEKSCPAMPKELLPEVELSIKDEAPAQGNNSKLSVDTEVKLNPEKFNVFPNPSNGTFDLAFELSTKGNTLIKVLDAAGRTIYSEELPDFSGSYRKQIDLPSGRGSYLLQVKQDDKWMHKKVVVR